MAIFVVALSKLALTLMSIFLFQMRHVPKNRGKSNLSFRTSRPVFLKQGQMYQIRVDISPGDLLPITCDMFSVKTFR